MANHNPKSVAAILERAQKLAQESNGALSAELAELLDNETKLDSELSKAQPIPGAIRSAWQKGKGEATALDLIEAEANIERLTALHKGFKSRAQSCQAKQTPPSHEVAEALVPHVASVLPGVTVLATHAPVSTWEEIPTNLYPVAVIVQTEETRTNADTGAVAAKVEIHYFRTRAHLTLSLEGVEQSAIAASAYLKFGMNRPAQGDRDYVTDVLRVEVLSAYAPRPAIPALASDAGKGFALGAVGPLLTDIGKRSLMTDTDGLRMQSGGAWEFRATGITVAGGSSSARKVAEQVEGDARIATLTDKLSVNITDQRHDLAYMVRRIESEARRQIGKVTPGLGRCDSVEVVSGARPDRSPFTPVRIVATFSSVVA